MIGIGYAIYCLNLILPQEEISFLNCFYESVLVVLCTLPIEFQYFLCFLYFLFCGLEVYVTLKCFEKEKNPSSLIFSPVTKKRVSHSFSFVGLSRVQRRIHDLHRRCA